MNKIKKLLKIGDTVYSARGGWPIRVNSICEQGFKTDYGFYRFEEVRSLYYLTKSGYEYAQKHRKDKK